MLRIWVSSAGAPVPVTSALGIKMNMSRIPPLLLMLLSSSPPANASDSNWINESAQATLSISKQSDNISFGYVNEGTYRCEISGIAKPTKSGGKNVYIFKNQPEYWQGKGAEGNGFPEINGDCTVSFNFSDSSVAIVTGKQIGRAHV